MELLIILILWGLCGWAAMAICRGKGRDPGLGLALGLVLGIIGVLIAAVLAPGDRVPTQRVYHPSTGRVTQEPVNPRDVCPDCGAARVNQLVTKCWRCGLVFAEVRTLIPDRPCPFCKAAIAGDALKCRHCGEWVVAESERPHL